MILEVEAAWEELIGPFPTGALRPQHLRRRRGSCAAATKGEDDLLEYQDQKNRFSIDGCPNTNSTRT